MMQALCAGRKGWVLPMGSAGWDSDGLQHYVEALAMRFQRWAKALEKMSCFQGLFHADILLCHCLIFVCLQHFICSFLFKFTSPQASGSLSLEFVPLSNLSFSLNLVLGFACLLLVVVVWFCFPCPRV